MPPCRNAVVCGGKVIEHGTHEDLLTIKGELSHWAGLSGHGWREASGTVCVAGQAKICGGMCDFESACLFAAYPAACPGVRLPAGGFYAGMVARQRMASKDDEQGAGSDDEEEEGGLRKKFSNKQAKSAKPVLRQSSESWGCRRRCHCRRRPCCRCRYRRPCHCWC